MNAVRHHDHRATLDRNVSLNRLAFSATVHCLTGCAIGEVLGLVLGTVLGWGNAVSVTLAVVLAFFFGYALTLRPLLTGGVGFRAALGLAFASDTLSITVMEIVDKAGVLALPRALGARLSGLPFWTSLPLPLIPSCVAAFPRRRLAPS